MYTVYNIKLNSSKLYRIHIVHTEFPIFLFYSIHHRDNLEWWWTTTTNVYIQQRIFSDQQENRHTLSALVPTYGDSLVDYLHSGHRNQLCTCRIVALPHGPCSCTGQQSCAVRGHHGCHTHRHSQSRLDHSHKLGKTNRIELSACPTDTHK